MIVPGPPVIELSLGLGTEGKAILRATPTLPLGPHLKVCQTCQGRRIVVVVDEEVCTVVEYRTWRWPTITDRQKRGNGVIDSYSD